MTSNLKIDTTEYVEYADYDHSNEWDRPNTYTSRTINHGILKGDEDYGDIIAPFDIKIGDKVFLLYVEWSTGNSFGNDENYGISYIGVFTDLELAEKNLEVIRNANRRSEDSWELLEEKFVIEHQDGSEEQYIDYSVPWYGYFKSMYSSGIKEILVRGSSDG